MVDWVVGVCREIECGGLFRGVLGSIFGSVKSGGVSGDCV